MSTKVDFVFPCMYRYTLRMYSMDIPFAIQKTVPSDYEACITIISCFFCFLTEQGSLVIYRDQRNRSHPRLLCKTLKKKEKC